MLRRLWVEIELFIDFHVKPLVCRAGMGWLYTDCPCCGFWRGVILGGLAVWMMK